jgi:hypothetical protein
LSDAIDEDEDDELEADIDHQPGRRTAAIDVASSAEDDTPPSSIADSDADFSDDELDALPKARKSKGQGDTSKGKHRKASGSTKGAPVKARKRKTPGGGGTQLARPTKAAKHKLAAALGSDSDVSSAGEDGDQAMDFRHLQLKGDHYQRCVTCACCQFHCITFFVHTKPESAACFASALQCLEVPHWFQTLLQLTFTFILQQKKAHDVQAALGDARGPHFPRNLLTSVQAGL